MDGTRLLQCPGHYAAIVQVSLKTGPVWAGPTLQKVIQVIQRVQETWPRSGVPADDESN